MRRGLGAFPFPACGERGGVEGDDPNVEPVERAPHPTRFARLPPRGPHAGRGGAGGPRTGRLLYPSSSAASFSLSSAFTGPPARRIPPAPRQSSPPQTPTVGAALTAG